MGDIVWRDEARGLTIHRAERPSPELVELLRQTVWGTEDFRYRICRFEEILRSFPAPLFLTLQRREDVIGGAVFNRKRVSVGEKCYDAYYLAFVSVRPGEMGQGYGKLLTEQARLYVRGQLGDKGLVYAYIETSNKRSIRVHEAGGYSVLATARPSFYLHPRARARYTAQPLASGELEGMRFLLQAQYREHALCDFEQSLRPGRYFVLKRDGHIIAGAQLERIHWQLQHMAGLSGFIALKLLPPVLGLRKRLAQTGLHMLRFGNLYVRTGYEAELPQLFETLLARTGLPLGITVFDERSEIVRRLDAVRGFSLLDHLVDDGSVVMVNCKGFTEAELEDLRSRPVHISPLDPM